MQALLRFQWEASEILVGQIYRVDICRNARSEAAFTQWASSST
ncbi:hypothetical protein ACFQH8_21635 [Halomicroarcula sp. GCM10025710]